MQSKDLYYDFLIKQFPIKRRKSSQGKWQRTIVIDSGLVRDATVAYKLEKGLQINIIASDLIIILRNVFTCTSNEAFDSVNKYMDGIIG